MRCSKPLRRMASLCLFRPTICYPTDHGWKFEGTLEKLMHEIKTFDRKGALNLDGFEGSGADWLARYKPYIITRRIRHDPA